MLTVGLVYFLLGKISVLLALPPGYSTAVWPPAGWALGFLLIKGVRFWPGVWLGSVLVNLPLPWVMPTDLTLWWKCILIPLGIGSGAAFQAVVGSWLIRKLVGFPDPMAEERRVLKFLLLGGPVAGLISSLVGCTILTVGGQIDVGRFAGQWFNWWTGDTIGALIFGPLTILLLQRPLDLRRLLAFGLPVGALFGLVVGLFILSANIEQAQLVDRYRQRGRDLVQRFQLQAERYFDVIYAVRSFFQGHPELDADDFHRMAGPQLERVKGLLALEWVPRVLPEARAEALKQLNFPGAPKGRFQEITADGRLEPVKQADRTIFPIIYVEPLIGNEAVRGIDLSSETVRRSFLEMAAITGHPVASQKIDLIQKSRPDQPGVLLILSADREGRPLADSAGVVLAVLDLDKVFQTLVDRPIGPLASLIVWEGHPETSLLYQNAAVPFTAKAADRDRLRQTPYFFSQTIQLAQQDWTFEIFLSPAVIEGQKSFQSWSFLALGMLLTSVLGAFLLVASGKAGLVQKLVNQKTSELVIEKQRAEAATQTKSRFLAAMSHEIRSPLNGVIAVADLLAHEPLTEGQKELVSTIRTSGDALLVVLNDILDFSKTEAGMMTLVPQVVDLEVWHRHILELFQPLVADKGLEIETIIDPYLPKRVVFDPFRVRQVASNLLSNAIKFTHRGTITFRIIRENRPDGLWIVFTVRDTGPGIAEDKVGLLFQDFRQLDEGLKRGAGGTGLGLAISRRLTELWAGDIRVKSWLGVGSEFKFSVPLVPVSDGATTEFDDPTTTSALPHLRVLLVDDSPVNLMIGRKALDRLGVTHVEVAGGEEALVQAQQSTWDIILMDIQMPGMDGLEAARQIRQLEQVPAPIIIALTAHAQTEDASTYAVSGMNDILPKPYKLLDLKKMLHRWAIVLRKT